MRLPRAWIFRPALAALAVLAIGAPSAVAGPIQSAPVQHYRLADGASMSVASQFFARPQIAPLVEVFRALPHGSELERLKLYVATDEEIGRACGEGTMACYDPGSERMLVSGQSEEVAGIPREAVIAHEYGHHIANNRRGGLWPALYAGTPRWATQEGVCELARSRQVFPGDQGPHYWENPGEAFAQAYSQMVYPQDDWHYSPLLQPDATSLEKLRLDIVDPLEPRVATWKRGAVAGPEGFRGRDETASAVGQAVVAPLVSFRRLVRTPVDGKFAVRLRTRKGGAYRLALRDPRSGAVLATSKRGRRSVARLDFSNCGHRSLLLEAIPAGDPGAFEAKITAP
jgi:hypothetical protein